MNLALRQYQQTIIGDIRTAFRNGHTSPILAAPTGSGKTVIFAHIADGAARRGKNILILVHRQELLLQCSRALMTLSVDHGLIAPGHSRTADHVQVASVQTLIRRLDKIIRPDLIIIDEGHHSRAGSWAKILEHFPGPTTKILGVTATPCRLDGRGLGVHAGGHYDTLVQGPQPAELIAQGYLSQPVIFAPPSDLNMAGVHTVAGDFNRKELSGRIEKSRIVGSCVEHYLKICPGQPAIAFCTSIKAAQQTAEEFKAAGVVAESLDGKMSDRDRKWRIDALGGGSIQVLTSCDIISEGTDIPIVAAAIWLRPTQSTGRYLQGCGRAMRPFPGKKYTVILDHVGNIYRHGQPDIDRQWTLDGGLETGTGTATDGGPAYYQCESCYAIYAVQLQICPQCGSTRITRDRSPEFMDGELSPIEQQRELAEKMAEEAERKRAYWMRRRENARAESLEDLKLIAQERGYKESWAHIIWNGREKEQRLCEAILRIVWKIIISVNPRMRNIFIQRLADIIMMDDKWNAR